MSPRNEVATSSESQDNSGKLPGFWRFAVLVLLCIYLALAAGHIYSTPISPSSEFNYINAPDEAAHLGYVKAIAVGRVLPVRGDLSYPTYEWHQPPLYYVLAAPFYLVSPIAVRWMTAFIGLISLILMVWTCRLIFPTDTYVSMMTLGVAALLPMRQAITSSVGNDALIEMMFVAEFMVIVRAMKSGLTLGRTVAVGFVLGAALITKATAFLLVPFICVAYILMLRNGERVKTIWGSALCCFAMAGCISGPWFARNVRLYGEFTPAKEFLREFEGTKKASDIIGPQTSRADYLRVVATMTAQSFFAAYTPHPALARGGSIKDTQQLRKMEQFARNGIPLFSEPGFYLPYAMYCIVGLLGLIRVHFMRDIELTSLQGQAVQLSLVLTALVFASFVAFIWTFFQTQGRYLYPVLFPISMCMAIGTRSIIPVRYRNPAALILMCLFAILAVAFLFTSIIPAYS